MYCGLIHIVTSNRVFYLFKRLRVFMLHLKSILSWPSCILFLAVVNNSALNTEGSHLLRKAFSIPLGPYPVVGPLGYAVIYRVLRGSSTLCSKMALIHSLTRSVQGFLSLYILSTLTLYITWSLTVAYIMNIFFLSVSWSFITTSLFCYSLGKCLVGPFCIL